MRLTDGEMEHPDSIHFPDSLKFTTPKGKIVYGGGGIMPDVYIPLDRSEAVKSFNKLANSGILYQFAFDYADRNRNALAKYRNYQEFDADFQVTENIMKEIAEYAAKNSVPLDNPLSPLVKKEIQSYVKSLIARVIYDDNGFYPIYNKTDKTVIKALEVLSQKKP
jgi:carboxyl-terminal processing protease